MASIVSGEGMQSGGSPTIAYLAPEIPALSATFVYEEMHGLERRGIRVVPVSVHHPHQPAYGKEDLTARVIYLYEGSKAKLVLAGLARLPLFSGAPRAISWLLSDLLTCGLFEQAAWKLVYQFLAGVRLAGILRREGCSHLHVHFAHVPSQIAMYASALVGIPFTIMAHANDIFERGLLLDRKASRAIRLLTISEYNRAYLESIGVAPDKLAVLRCGVSFPTGQIGPERHAGDTCRIGTLGRLVDKKGVDVLIRAIALLRDRPCRVELAIAGDGPLRNELEGLVKELGLVDAVCFEGNMPHDRVRSWMRGLDLFVLASKPDANGDMDGIPVVLMEAMSQSIPVISTRLSGIPELILDGQTGLLANPGDPGDLAEQIDRLLGAPELRHRLTSQALEYVQREFGLEVNLDRLIGHLALATI
jgi:glycosyltransferase involved in cell wall biosynthesis